MTSFVPLDSVKHANQRFVASHPCPAADKQHLIPLGVGECVIASADFPIVFVKDHNTGQMRLTALVGLKPGESVFYSDEGWSATYVPLSIRPSVIALSPSPSDEEKFVVALDIESPFLGTTDGHALFSPEGEKTEYLQYQIDLAQDRHAQSSITETFIADLIDSDLLRANTLTIQPKGGSTHELSGFYVIDEKVMDDLPNEEFQSLRAKGFLANIYAIRASMYRLDNLLRKQQGD